jgi:hypothetical protein
MNIRHAHSAVLQQVYLLTNYIAISDALSIKGTGAGERRPSRAGHAGSIVKVR